MSLIKTLPLIGLLLITATAQAFYFSGGGAEGQIRYVYAETANVREAADEQSTIIDKLPAGEEVTVLFQTSQKAIVNNVEANWLKVSYQQQGNSKEGYIWEGSLSFDQLRRGDVKFVYGVESYDNQQRIYTAKIRAIKNGIVVSEQNFQPNHVGMIEGSILKQASLTDVEQIIMLTFSGTSCGLGYANYYFAWTGKELIYLLKGFEVGEDTYNDGATIIFPPASSMDDVIIKLIRSGKSDNENSPIQWQIKTELYQWQKNHLELKEQTWPSP